jgi:hypothetical protein
MPEGVWRGIRRHYLSMINTNLCCIDRSRCSLRSVMVGLFLDRKPFCAWRRRTPRTRGRSGMGDRGLAEYEVGGPHNSGARLPGRAQRRRGGAARDDKGSG